MKKVLLLASILIYPLSSWAVFYEVGSRFSYDKKVYGEQRQNSSVSKTWSASLAVYLLNRTAIEFNYSQTKNIVEENNRVLIDSDLEITSIYNLVESDVYGVGIRQAFASSKALLVPMISIGYAKQFNRGKTQYTLRAPSNGATTSFETEQDRKRYDSVFATFTLKFRISQTMSIDGSINTIFRAFEFSEARDSMKYGAGISWLF